MLECLIMGDSIGYGIAHYRQECVSHVKSGINSTKFLSSYPVPSEPFKTAIISLGTNDTDKINTYHNLRTLRLKTSAKKVWWIVPSKTLKPSQYEAVKKLAREFGDSTITITSGQLSADRIHPTGSGYKSLGQMTK